MKTLILLRHGKSDWGDAALGDHARPLNARGRLAAALMGAWLADEGFVPEAALVSTAARTRETWGRLVPMLADAPKPLFRDDLYLAEPEVMRAAIADAPEVERLILLGHNPGIEALAMCLSEGTGARLSMPTCAVAVISFESRSWADIGYGDGELLRFETPKSLV